MGIDLTTLITNLQADVNAADSDTSIRDILALLHRGSKITTFHKWYDSAGVLPIDSAYGGYIAFTKNDNALRVFNDSDRRWAALDSALGPGTVTLPAVDMRGTSYGYNIAGSAADMNKYSFTSDGNATDIGDYSVPVGPITDATIESGSAGQSATAGYVFNHYGDGYSPGVSPASWTRKDAVKYPYATDAVSQTTATMLTGSPGIGLYRGTVDAVGNRTYAYQLGGQDYAASPAPTSWVNIIGKFATATDANATDVGDLAAVKGEMSGASSDTHGYVTGGYNQATQYTIEKVSFSSDGNSTSVGNLVAEPGSPVRNVYNHTGGQSDTHGYSIGGQAPPGLSPTTADQVSKFAFASDGNATNLGDQMNSARRAAASTSSSTHIFTAGGNSPVSPSGVNINEIEKFTVASDTGGTDVGDLSSATQNATGSAT